MTIPEFLFQAKHSPLKLIVMDYIKQKNYKCIEIEARVGMIVNKITKKRIEFETSHPILFNTLPNEFYFESGVDEKEFHRIKNAIAGENKLITISDKITILNHIRRIETGNEIIFQKKERIKSMDIYLPDFNYDVRVSVSKETEEKKGPSDLTRKQFVRIRHRETLNVGPFAFDFTKVVKMHEDSAKSFEIELEIKDCEEGLVDFSNIIFSLPTFKNK